MSRLCDVSEIIGPKLSPLERKDMTENKPTRFNPETTVGGRNCFLVNEKPHWQEDVCFEHL